MMDDGPFGRDAFLCAPSLRLESHERIVAVQLAQFTEKLTRIEVIIERLERRLWLTVYGVVAVVLGDFVVGLAQNGF